MVNFNQTKGQLSSIEHAMKSLQVDLEKAQFALEVKKGVNHCQSLHCEADGICKCCWLKPSNDDMPVMESSLIDTRIHVGRAHFSCHDTSP